MSRASLLEQGLMVNVVLGCQHAFSQSKLKLKYYIDSCFKGIITGRWLAQAHGAQRTSRMVWLINYSSILHFSWFFSFSVGRILNSPIRAAKTTVVLLVHPVCCVCWCCLNNMPLTIISIFSLVFVSQCF